MNLLLVKFSIGLISWFIGKNISFFILQKSLNISVTTKIHIKDFDLRYRDELLKFILSTLVFGTLFTICFIAIYGKFGLISLIFEGVILLLISSGWSFISIGFHNAKKINKPHNSPNF